MPRERERHLVVVPVPAQTIAPVLAGESLGQFPLAGPLAEYDEWDLVSHTFDVRDDGSAILTAVLESRVRSSRRRQQEGSSGEASKEERREQRKQERMRRKQERVRGKEERAQRKQERRA